MLHPQARAVLDLIEAADMPPTHLLPPQVAREGYRARRHVLQPDPQAVAEVRDIAADCGHGVVVPLRLYRPTAGSAALPVLVYFHGGGWTIGDLDTHDVLCRALANGSGCAVVAVDYRMGPEHRFPAAVDDALAATRWVSAHAAELGLDAARLAVGGDSAGGNLAAVVAIAARDAGDLPIAYQLLIYPATDMRAVAPSHRTNGEGYLLTGDTIAYFRGHYIDDARHHADWRASPLLADSLHGLPPALLLTAGYDPLRDEGLAYAQRLTDAGNRGVTYVCFERQIHGFITMGRVLDEANAAVAMCAGEVRRALAPSNG